MLRREIDESSLFPKPMADWKTSKLNEEVHELKANSISHRRVLLTRRKSNDHVTLGLDRDESMVKRLSLHNVGIAGHCKGFTGELGLAPTSLKRIGPAAMLPIL